MSGLSKIVVTVGTSGLGRQALNNDKISGFLTYNANLPSGFSSSNRVQKVLSLSDAEALGITNTTNFLVEHYHISEFFRMNPEGALWIGWYAVPGSYTYVEVASMIVAAQGEIRQLGIFASVRPWTSADCTVIQAVIDGIDPGYNLFSVLLACDFTAITAVTGWAAVTDLRTLNARKVTPIIAESGSGQGLVLSVAKAYSITSLGTALGCISKAGVEESIGNPARFPLSDGIEMETLALANGDLLSAITTTVQGNLKDKGYLIARKYLPDLTGSYFERCPTACPFTSDFAFIENNRMVDKLIRLVRSALTPYLQGTLAVNANGTLSNDAIGFYKDLAQSPADGMAANGELSQALMSVDPNQNVVSTSKLVISGKVIPIGIAEEIDFNIDLVTSIT